MKTNCGRCWRENTQAEQLPVMLVGRSCMKNFLLGINKVAVCHVREGIIIGFMPQHVVCNNVLRLAGELPIVRVLNDFQSLPILRIFCMGGFASPPTDPP